MNTEPTNQPPEWAVKAANEVLEQLFKSCGIVASDNVTPDLAAIIASHAPKDLIEAARRVLECKQLDLESIGTETGCSMEDAREAFTALRSAIQSAEQK